jgi:hypothetical protein
MLTPYVDLPAQSRRQSLYIQLYLLAETCVFDKQSVEPLLCHFFTEVKEALLIPKLRSQFAEFLYHSSLDHRWNIHPTYLCQFWYG